MIEPAHSLVYITAHLAQYRHQSYILILTKIIIITDGRATEADLISGPDVHDSSKIDEVRKKHPNIAYHASA
jgi:hypothetical protein